MDCPTCPSSVVERQGTPEARLFQCRWDDTQYMISRTAFDAFVQLGLEAQRASLDAARRRCGLAMPVVTLEDIAIAQT